MLQAAVDPALLAKVVAMSRASEEDAGATVRLRVSPRDWQRNCVQPSRSVRLLATSTSQC